MSEDPELLRLYGRRKGKPLKPGRARLMESLLPKIRIAPPKAGELIDPGTLFDSPVHDIFFEVGFGGGEHIAAQAAAHPEIGFIGCEPFINGVANLLGHVDQADLRNIRIFDEDARLILDALPDACIGRAFILFPDPWPKRRHNKRRFVQRPNLDRLARVLKDDAELRFASDHANYMVWALERLTADSRFTWLAKSPADWKHPPADWMPTRYEEKARDEGRSCTYLRFKRVAR